MTKLYPLLLSFCAVLAVNAQSSPDQPAELRQGHNSVTVDWNSFRQTNYYTYTATAGDELLSLSLPTENATVVATTSPGDYIDSDISYMLLGDAAENTALFRCYAPLEATVYLKVSFQTWGLPEGTTDADIEVWSEACQINYGLDPGNPIAVTDGQAAFLPLTAQVDPPYLPIPVYVSYTAAKSGWLYLNFAPSVTSVHYSSSIDGTYTLLKHEYLHENGKTVGAKAKMEVQQGEQLLFKIAGFNAVMLSTSIENPEPGTTCDFPLDIVPGEITLPADAGDYYYRFTPDREGFAELTSESRIPAGFIEVAMDCQGTGSFAIRDFIHLRTWVYDRMEYLVHINKVVPTEADETFTLSVTDALPCDDPYTAEGMIPGETYTTVPFAGTYYYRITAPADTERIIKLTPLAQPQHEDTRVNLHEASDLSLSVARGLDLSYPTVPGREYILKWTVFDTANEIPFMISLDQVNSVHDIMSPDSNAGVLIFRPDGTCAGSRVDELSPGLYIISTPTSTAKTIIK